MALGTGLSGTGGALDLYVPEVWSARTQLAFEKKLVAQQFGLNLSELLAAQGGDILRVPKMANRSAASSRALTAFTQITPAGITESQFSMNVQTWVTTEEAISDAVAPQTKLFKLSQLEHKMYEAVARKFDTDLLALNSSLTTTAQGTDDGATVPSPDNFFAAMETLDLNSVPREDRIVIVGPKTFWDLVRNNTITSKDYADNMAKATGIINILGGIPVIMSQNVPDSAAGSELNLVMHKEAFAFAIGSPIRVRSEHLLDYLQTAYVADMLYGVGCYRTDSGVVVYGR